jgi:hypothetical protein
LLFVLLTFRATHSVLFDTMSIPTLVSSNKPLDSKRSPEAPSANQPLDSKRIDFKRIDSKRIDSKRTPELLNTIRSQMKMLIAEKAAELLQQGHPASAVMQFIVDQSEHIGIFEASYNCEKCDFGQHPSEVRLCPEHKARTDARPGI